MRNLLVLLTVLWSFFAYSQTVKESFAEAHEKWEQQDYKGAIIGFNKVIEMDPDNEEAYNIRAQCLYKLEEDDN